MSNKIYGNKSVWDAAIERIEYLFDEFENIVVAFSGGKDSTVTLNLALMVAERKGRLPIPVLFIDQEAEWDCNIEYMREVMNDPRVKPLWMQIPFRIFNATSEEDEWLHAWEPGKEDVWIRQKEDIAIKINPTKVDRFGKLFDATLEWVFGNKPYCSLSGVRTEESTGRARGLTGSKTYKWITWGRACNKAKKQFVFYPLYDWSYTDIWKAIHDNGWSYCRVYDYMYQYGTPIQEMRVSNITHETAIKSLIIAQEVEGDLWRRLTRRLRGVNTAGKMNATWGRPKELPFMFETWHEYRDYLLDKLIQNPEHKAIMQRQITTDDPLYCADAQDRLAKMHIDMILKNDYHGTKRSMWKIANSTSEIKYINKQNAKTN